MSFEAFAALFCAVCALLACWLSRLAVRDMREAASTMKRAADTYDALVRWNGGDESAREEVLRLLGRERQTLRIVR